MLFRSTVLSNTILNANVSAEDKVITTGKKGAVIGGYVHGFKGIEAMTAGSDAEVKTILHSGYEMKSYERLLEIRRRESEIKAKLSELVDNMTDAMRETRMGSTSLSLAAEIKMAERDRMKDQYFEELDKISREREMLEELMEASQGAYIKVDGTMYRNLVICINVEIGRASCRERV